MKKILFSLFLILLLVLALFGRERAEDFGNVNFLLVSYISESPVAREVFSLTEAAVET